MIEVEARGGADTAPLVARLVRTCERLGLGRGTMGLMVVGPDEMARIRRIGEFVRKGRKRGISI